MGFFYTIIQTVKNLFELDKRQEIKEPTGKQTTVEEIHSVWDYIKFIEQSQAHHICSVLGFEEWITMEEILRRIKEIFGIEYKNERSLYPYIKTLVDCGFLETTAFGGKMKWRKKEVLIKIKTNEKAVYEKTATAVLKTKS